MSEYQPPLTPTNARVIKPSYDSRGNPVWKSRMSAPDDSFAMCLMVPDRIIPVIFVPGVMGSNLIEKGAANRKQAVKWRMDSGPAAASAWATKDAAYRKRFLNPATMEVDTEGAIPKGTQQPDEELRRRGWGEIGALSYAEALVWLEKALNDFDDPHDPNGGERVKLMSSGLNAEIGEALLTQGEVGLSYKYRFPVYACGYNWLDDNANSAARLSQRIDEVLQRYRSEGKKVEKVIIVTHSMGGLVARHCSEVLGRRKDIFGIVHGVMPAIGAAAVYRRFKAGTEDPTAWWNVTGAIATAVLGNNAAEMTAVLSSSPGPLQLLPTPEYGNGWLKIKDGANEYSLPSTGDPYGEIYTVRGKWWSMCEEQLMNPLNEESDPKKRQVQTDADWQVFSDIIQLKVQAFHSAIKGRYHPETHAFCGNSEAFKAYGTVTWTGDGGGWLRGARSADVMGARTLDSAEVGITRTVAAPLSGSGWAKAEHQSYRISEPDEHGDGTVPRRSGLAPKGHVKSFLQVSVGHEPAYRASVGADNLRACRFTVRAIVKLAQQVQSTSLKYE